MILSLDFYRSEQSLNNDMMKYRLKSKYIQKRLDEISGGDFTERLQESASEGWPYVSVLFGDLPHFSATFDRKEIEEVPALYDPKIWNEWPDAEPPAHVLMRVEIITGHVPKNDLGIVGRRPRFRGCAVFDGQYWDFNDKACLCRGETVRFRPWEDKE